jgi:hypothetical protein
LANGFFRVWCTDETVRRSALLARIDSYLGARSRLDPADVIRQIMQVTRQLDLNGVGIPEIRDMAASSGNTSLAAQLDELIHSTQA